MEGKEILDQIIVGRVDPYIYAFSTNTIPNYLKIGDTYRPVSVRLNEWKKYFPDLEEEYKEKAIINDDVFFRDYAVHKFIEEELGKTRLIESMLEEGTYYSNEFFENATSDDVKEAIKDIKKSYEENDNKYQFYDARTSLPEIFQFKREDVEWEPRPNQQEAINNFIKARANNRKNLLMYAVMRFGKSFTAMMCAKEMKAKLVVIVSAKADVKIEWKKTVEQPKNFEGYSFVSADELTRNNNEIKDRLNNGESVAVFLTLQDLQGDLIKDRHKDVFKNRIDLLIVDETHFGARADSYGKILESTKYVHDIRDKYESEIDRLDVLDENIKALDVDTTLHLSGTPYRILMGSEFEKEDIISFCQFSDIVKEQEQWDEENILNDETKEWKNPYYGFPQMIRFAFNPSKKAKEKLAQYRTSGYTYAFSALLKPKSISKSSDGLHKKFENEEEVLELFEAIDGSKNDENVLGFLNYDKIKEGKMCRHIVCVLPYCASCDALEELINNNRDKFKNLKDYKIINISGTDISNEYNKISKIKNAIKKCEEENIKTLTLTVNRMLTGSTVEQWDTMIYLKDTSSPQEYDQSIFRLQNQYIKEYVDEDGNVIKYNMKPQTLLVDFDPYRMFILQEAKSKIYNVNVEETGNSLLEERIKDELRISPIISINKNKITKVQPKNIMDAVSNYSISRGILEEVNDIPVDLHLLDNELIKNIIEKQAEIGSNLGFDFDAYDENEGEDYDVPLASDNLDNSDKSSENSQDLNNETEIDNTVNYEKKIRTYFSRILFYAFLTSENVISLSQIIESINNDTNRRIAGNLGISKNILQLMNKNMDPFKLSQLDYKIQNINQLSNDQKISPIERAIIAMNKFSKWSRSEIVTPIEICKNMVDMIDSKRFSNKNIKILDIASKMGEFSIALYEKLLSMGIDKSSISSIIYSIPTSSIAYEFTIKIYEILNLNTDNISERFNTYDLLNINKEELSELLYQDKKFCEIELEKNLLYKKGNGNMKFDLIIGNPPYQKNIGDTSDEPIYNEFMNSAYVLSDNACLITPAKFLFNAGKTPKEWNKKMLNDEHFKILKYYQNSSDVFNGITFTGGVAISYYDRNTTFGKIGTFLPYNELSSILNKVIKKDFISINSIIYSPESYKFSDALHDENPDIINLLSSGHKYDIVTNIFSKLPTIFTDDLPANNGYVKFLGLSGRNRVFKYIKEKYIKEHDNLKYYKVFLPKSNGSGAIGEVIPTPLIGEPLFGEKNVGHTQSFISIGKFNDSSEANALLKYIKTKFARALLGTLKVTQDNKKDTWSNVPMQDFSNKSDIDWSESIENIDKQLYSKYNLNKEEISFIESRIKEME